MSPLRSRAILGGIGVASAATVGVPLSKWYRGREDAGSVRHAPLTVLSELAGGMALFWGAIGLAKPGCGSRARMESAAYLGAGGAAVLSTNVVGPAAFNTFDRGLNRMERADFRRENDRRVESFVLVGAALTGVPVAGVARFSGPTKRPLPQVAAAAAIALGFGIATSSTFAAIITAGGQDRPFRSSVDAIDGVTRELWNGVAAAEGSSASFMKVGAQPIDGARASDRADGARFYAAADDAGDGDGQLTEPELRAHVATFDADGDGRVEWKSEWAALHAAIVA